MMSEKTVRRSITDSELPLAKKRAMYLLGLQDYSSAALRDKLRADYSEKTCDSVIDLLTDYGYLDDRRFAERLAEKLLLRKRYGAYRAKVELARKGFDSKLIAQVLSAYDKEVYREKICELLESKYAGRLDDKDELRKVTASLVRRGYSYSDISAAINDTRKNTED